MASVVRMPSVLAGATEAAIASWLVAPGDAVSVGDPLAEIETEKAIVEYSAEEAGVVGRLVLAAGAAGEIGAPIAVLVKDGETDADIDAALSGEAPAAAAAAPAGTPAVSAPDPAAPSALAAPRAPTRAGAPAARRPRPRLRRPPRPCASSPARSSGRSPASRASTSPASPGRARTAGSSAATSNGSPPVTGRRRAARAPAPRPHRRRLRSRRPPRQAASQPAPAPASAAGTLIPHTPVRRAIARRLTESTTTTPHFYMTTECVVDELLALRERINETAPVKISVNDFVVMAVAAAFGDVPEANVTWSDEGLVAYPSVNVSIAVATDGGLVTPVLRGVEAKRLSVIAGEARTLAQRARDRRLLQHELEGGVFSVSNLGMYGTLEFSAIINPPQSGILAVGAAKPQPVVTGGAVSVATVMRCTLSVDHRAIDGVLAARWLAAFTTRIQAPLGMIA